MTARERHALESALGAWRVRMACRLPWMIRHREIQAMYVRHISIVDGVYYPRPLEKEDAS